MMEKNPKIEEYQSESFDSQLGDQEERLVHSEISLLRRFRGGKAWRAAKALVLISLLTTAGSEHHKGLEEENKTAITTEDIEEKKLALEKRKLALSETEYRELARVNPELVLSEINLYEYKPWASNVIGEAVDSALKNDPILAFKYASQYAKYPWASEKLKDAINHYLNKEPRTVLRFSKEIKTQSWGMEKIKTALGAKGITAVDILRNAEGYKDEPWAQERIKKAVEECIKTKITAYAAVEYSSNYINQPGGAELLQKAVKIVVETDPYEAIENADQYKNQAWGPEMLKKALVQIMKKHPPYALRLFRKYESEPWGLELLKEAVDKSIEKDSREVLQYHAAFIDQPWRTEKIHQAVEQLMATDDIQSVLEFASVYKNESSWGKEKLKQAVEKAIEKRSGAAIEFAKEYRMEPWGEAKLKEAVEKTIERDVESAINFAENYVVENWGDNMLRKAVEKASEADPTAVIIYGAKLQKIKNYSWLSSEIDKSFGRVIEKDDIRRVFSAIEKYKQEPWFKGKLRRAVEKATVTNPALLLWETHLYLGEDYAENTIRTAIKKDPFLMFSLMIDEGVFPILEKSEDFAIKTLLEIRDAPYKKYIKADMPVLLDEIVNQKMSLEAAAAIAQNPAKLFETVVKIKNQPGHLGEFSIERWLSYFSLRKVREVNDLHEQPDAKRFQCVEKAGPKEIYTLMVYGEEEIFTSSFNGLFDRLINAMKKEKVGGEELLKSVGNNKFRSFIKLATGFNRLNEFLNTMSDNAKVKLLEKFAGGLDKEKDSLSQAVVIADVFGMVDNEALLKIFQETIKNEYERVKKEKNKNAEIVYGLLAGMFEKKMVVNEDWIMKMSEKYRLPNLIEIPSAKLFNRDGTNIQQYFFYNDEDGRASFSSFMSQYKDKPDWMIENKDGYVVISSRPEKNRLEIYANEPSRENEGQEAIKKTLAKRNLESIVIVHRGHSYHVHRTIERIPAIAKIVSLGSCGGYTNIDAVLKMAPDAHIISTKGVGTMSVNDPLFKMLNEKIKQGTDINWPKFWQEAEKNFGTNKDFANYVPPHKNLGVLFLKAYNQYAKTS